MITQSSQKPRSQQWVAAWRTQTAAARCSSLFLPIVRNKIKNLSRDTKRIKSWLNGNTRTLLFPLPQGLLNDLQKPHRRAARKEKKKHNNCGCKSTRIKNVCNYTRQSSRVLYMWSDLCECVCVCEPATLSLSLSVSHLCSLCYWAKVSGPTAAAVWWMAFGSAAAW